MTEGLQAKDVGSENADSLVAFEDCLMALIKHKESMPDKNFTPDDWRKWERGKHQVLQDTWSAVTRNRSRRTIEKALSHPPESKWQPIETAPKDGGLFLVCLPRMMNLIVRARFNSVHKQWLTDEDNDGAVSKVNFFHAGDLWQPMPPPPKKLMENN